MDAFLPVVVRRARRVGVDEEGEKGGGEEPARDHRRQRPLSLCPHASRQSQRHEAEDGDGRPHPHRTEAEGAASEVKALSRRTRISTIVSGTMIDELTPSKRARDVNCARWDTRGHEHETVQPEGPSTASVKNVVLVHGG